MAKSLQELMQKDKRDFNFVKPKGGEIDRPRLPSGIFPLDYALGGGLPIYDTSTLFGEPKAGKTSLSYKFIESAQKMCWQCLNYKWDCTCESGPTEKFVVFVSVEGFDSDWAEKVGVDLDKLFVSEPETGELAVDLVYETLQAEDCCGVVLDSLGRVIPEDEITDSAANLKVGGRAKLHARLINKAKACLLSAKKNKDPKFFLAINQVRANIGAFMASESTPGGYASQHDWTLGIRQSQLKPKSQFIDSNSNLPIVGRYKSNFTSPASKRKLFVISGAAEWYMAMNDNLYPVGTPVDYKVTFKYAEGMRLVSKSPFGIIGDNESFKNQKEMMQTWLANPDYYRSIKRLIVDEYVKAERGQVEKPEPPQDMQAEIENEEEEENG